MKVIILKAPLNAMLSFSRIIETYVDAAYPPGGSECAQSAREALLTAAARLQHEYDSANGTVSVSRRIKAHLKAALSYYSDSQQQNRQVQLQREQLLKCLDGADITDESWLMASTTVI